MLGTKCCYGVTEIGFIMKLQTTTITMTFLNEYETYYDLT